MKLSLDAAVSKFGAAVKAKLTNVAASGEPEDQLRAPFETLASDLAELSGLERKVVSIVGESALSDLKTRPDYAVTVRNALVGFVEIKAPGKGADPHRFRDKHDKDQWQKLSSLPNLIYTDGTEFSLWRNGELLGEIIKLSGDPAAVGESLSAPPSIVRLFDDFFKWQPIPPRDAKQLATVSARLCRLLREEVAEQLARGSEALTSLAVDWRKMLFPEATDAQFADGYAQAVTFGLLVARARGIELSVGLDRVARELNRSNTLIGTALRVLTDDTSNQETLKTSLGTLTRVLDVVNWATVSKGSPEAWLYFYEDFLEVYDNDLRKQTGSYYTPPEVVGAMVRLVDETLRSPEAFDLPSGLAAPQVTIADPAIGTGTFLLGVLRGIAESVKADQGDGAVAEAINAAIDRLIGFEMQLGPFAVAQLRVLAELADLMGETPTKPPRMYVTDTLGDPFAELEWLPGMLKPIGESRREANVIKRQTPITVVIGNPPYKEKAKGRGGWVEKGHGDARAILTDWQPPREWKVGAHAKHLRNLYIYFWRWATWKVFDANPDANTGVVAFITVAGFLNGPGFQKMRDYLRRTANRIWVIDCSPEGHQPDVPTRVFQGVQHPVCIVIAARSAVNDGETPAIVRFAALPEGRREGKFDALARLTIDGPEWRDCPADWRAPFLPQATGSWASFVPLESVFIYHGSGVMPGRTWIIAPDRESLADRWRALTTAKAADKESLFHPHLVDGKPGDRHVNRGDLKPLPGFPDRKKAVADEGPSCPDVVPYGFRSFDRQWIIADNRVINRPNPTVWEQRSERQVYLTAPTDQSPSAGPSISFCAEVCDLHHYNGRGGRAFPLWSDAGGKTSNVAPKMLASWGERLKRKVDAPDVMAYLAAIAANPSFVRLFADDLRQPGIRIPITADSSMFGEAVAIGNEVIWLHTFGERFVDAKAGRAKSPPRMFKGTGPRVPAGGAIPSEPDRMPDVIEYDAAKKRLTVGDGYIEPVAPEVWAYEVSGKQVLRQWFSYRKLNRERPIIGDRRPPSPLGDLQPNHWLAEYTTELLNVLHVLGRLVALEPKQADLLERICAGPLLTDDDLRKARLYDKPAPTAKPSGRKRKDGEGQQRFA
jgi:hypothetical protein